MASASPSNHVPGTLLPGDGPEELIPLSRIPEEIRSLMSARDAAVETGNERLGLLTAEYAVNAELRRELERTINQLRAAEVRADRAEKAPRQDHAKQQERAAEIFDLVNDHAAALEFSITDITCDHEDCLSEGGDGFIAEHGVDFCPAHRSEAPCGGDR